MNKEILEEVIRDSFRDYLLHGKSERLVQNILSDERLSKPILSSVAPVEDWVSISVRPKDDNPSKKYWVCDDYFGVILGKWCADTGCFYDGFTQLNVSHYMEYFTPQPPTEKESEA
jgi:hypothetical protein